MPIIDPSSRLGAFLRPNAADLKRPAAPDAPSQGKASGLQRDQARNTNPFLDSLALLEPKIRQQLLQRVRALSKEDARQPRKVFQLFMESVLMQEFVGDAGQDMDWKRLADPVVDQMESDPELASAIKDAARHLIDAAAALPQA
jgi:hypothetical protein